MGPSKLPPSLSRYKKVTDSLHTHTHTHTYIYMSKLSSRHMLLEMVALLDGCRRGSTATSYFPSLTIYIYIYIYIYIRACSSASMPRRSGTRTRPSSTMTVSDCCDACSVVKIMVKTVVKTVVKI